MQLAIIGEFNPAFEPHVQTDQAIEHSVLALGLDVQSHWISSADRRIRNLDGLDAIWFAPGSPYLDLESTLAALRFARESKLPTLGTCGGFQHMVIEVARHVVGIADAQHAEYDPYASRLIVSRLTCSLAGREMPVRLVPRSLVADAYGATEATEKYYCDFGVNAEFITDFSRAGFVVSGRDQDGEVRVMELREHPFFVGTLFVPQANSTPAHPHPLVSAFLRSAQSSVGDSG